MYSHKAHAEVPTTGCRINLQGIWIQPNYHHTVIHYEKSRNIIALTANTANSAPLGLYIHFTTCFPMLITGQKESAQSSM